MTSLQPGYRHVYVHVPFCTRRCSYCDFSIAVRRDVPWAEFSTAIAAELAVRGVSKRDTPESQLVTADTVYFGGGTPSKLGPEGVAQLVRSLQEGGIRIAEGAEVTVEANPEDTGVEAVQQWLQAGVTRLSIGVQSFAPDALAWMHRSHDSAQAAEAVRSARLAGASNISLDIIYALPNTINRSLRDDLARAIDLGPDHLSIYGLTVEPRTPLGRWTARGSVFPRTADQAADEFLEAHELLLAAGFEHYEVSNYARPGFRSRHNSAYWERVPYLGIGPSAHSYDGVVRRWNIPAYAAWAAAVARGRDPLDGEERLGERDRVTEEAYLGLRTDAGYEVASESDLAAAGQWVREGWATLAGRRLRLTPEGWLRLDALAASLAVP